MKRLVTILTILVLFIVTGCMSAEEQLRLARLERANLVAQFQQTYPNTWEDKLFQYDMQQQMLREQARQNAVRMWNYNYQQSQNRLYGN